MAQENASANAGNNGNNGSHPNRQRHGNNKRYGYNSKTYQQHPPRENRPQPQASQQGTVERRTESSPARAQAETAGASPGAGQPVKKNNNFRGGRREKQNIKPEETVEAIRNDLKRIEKEIALEIKEIGALKLGL